MFRFSKKIDSRNQTGSFGEESAAAFLCKKGYKIVGKNYRNKIGRQIGEIDIIAYDKNCLVFVEVKTRSTTIGKFGFPAEANITRNKLRKLEKIANSYLKTKNLLYSQYRFDAISVYVNKNSQKITEIKHMENIFF